jgi:hypothetical protein
LGERLNGIQEVDGSIPFGSTKKSELRVLFSVVETARARDACAVLVPHLTSKPTRPYVARASPLTAGATGEAVGFPTLGHLRSEVLRPTKGNDMRFAHLLTTILFVSTSSLLGQEVTATDTGAQRSASGGPSIATDTYGSASQWLTLSAWDFHGLASADTYTWYDGGGTFPLGIYGTGGSGGGSACLLAAPLHLSEGALITAFEFQACDNLASGQILFFLDTIPKTGSTYTDVNLVNTGVGSGCVLTSLTLPSPITIDNANNTYFLKAEWGLNSPGLILQSARVRYKLQISPDPATATFADVPVGHPFHRFVEALYASGITGGCGGGNYCPDAPVTRGQMAVFLAGALGLHWAP